MRTAAAVWLLLVLTACASGPRAPLMTPRAAGVGYGHAESNLGDGRYEVRYLTPVEQTWLSRTKRAEGPLTGERFVFTGTLSAMSRSRAESLVASLGAEAVSSVTRKVTHLVAGADPGGKIARAEGYEIDVMDEAAFLSLLREHGVEPDA